MHFKKTPARSLTRLADGTWQASLISSARTRSSSNSGGGILKQDIGMSLSGGLTAGGKAGTQCAGLSAKATASDRYGIWFPRLEGKLFREETELRHRMDGRVRTELQVTGYLPWEHRQLMHDLQRERIEQTPGDLVLVAGFWYRCQCMHVDASRNERTVGAMADLRVNIEFALFPIFDEPIHPVLALRRRIGRRLRGN